MSKVSYSSCTESLKGEEYQDLKEKRTPVDKILVIWNNCCFESNYYLFTQSPCLERFSAWAIYSSNVLPIDSTLTFVIEMEMSTNVINAGIHESIISDTNSTGWPAQILKNQTKRSIGPKIGPKRSIGPKIGPKWSIKGPEIGPMVRYRTNLVTLIVDIKK